MNPLTKVKLINELNEREANLGVNDKSSWHNIYKDSAWIFIGGFPYELSEGDLVCVFSQYGEVVNINLVRDKKTGKSKGFCFLCYDDQRSTILAVDNFNGIKIKGRTIRVDHVKDYRPPKDSDDIDDVTKQLYEEGCAPQAIVPPSSSSEEEVEEEEEQYVVPHKKSKKDKKEKKKKKKKDKKKERESRESSSSSSNTPVAVKQEKEDIAYNKYKNKGPPVRQNQSYDDGERGRETDRHGSRREIERGIDRREMDRDGRTRETGDRTLEMERDERRREKDVDEKRAVQGSRREDREERSNDGRRKKDRRREGDSDDGRRFETGREERRRDGDDGRKDRDRDDRRRDRY